MKLVRYLHHGLYREPSDVGETSRGEGACARLMEGEREELAREEEEEEADRLDARETACRTRSRVSRTNGAALNRRLLLSGFKVYQRLVAPLRA